MILCDFFFKFLYFIFSHQQRMSSVISYLLSARKEGEKTNFELQYPSTTGESEEYLFTFFLICFFF